MELHRKSSEAWRSTCMRWPVHGSRVAFGRMMMKLMSKRNESGGGAYIF